MLNELLAILDVVDRVLKKRKVNTEQRIRDKVLVAIYKLGNEGSQAVTPVQLETEGGLSKLQIFDAVEVAKSKNWIIDAPSLSGGMAWMLKREAIYYVKGLLES